jgi:hypothetical protein
MAEDSGRERDDHQKSQRADRQPAQPDGTLEGQLAPGYAPLSPGSLLGDSRLGGRGNAPVKVALMRQAQQTYGNRALRRALQPKLATGATNVAAPPQLGSSPPSGVIFIQRLKTGIAENNKKNIAKAKKELAEITDPADVSDACEELEKLETGVLARYKSEYKNDYLANLGDQLMFQWPLSYLRGRAARKLGKSTEDTWIKAVYGSGVSKNNQEFLVEDDNGEYEGWIPDVYTDGVVADVKNVASQSFSAQLRAFYAIAKHKDPITNEKRKIATGGKYVPKKIRSFEMIVRSKAHSDGKTELSGPLESAADAVYYVIT